MVTTGRWNWRLFGVGASSTWALSELIVSKRYLSMSIGRWKFGRGIEDGGGQLQLCIDKSIENIYTHRARARRNPFSADDKGRPCLLLCEFWRCFPNKRKKKIAIQSQQQQQKIGVSHFSSKKEDTGIKITHPIAFIGSWRNLKLISFSFLFWIYQMNFGQNFRISVDLNIHEWTLFKINNGGCGLAESACITITQVI